MRHFKIIPVDKSSTTFEVFGSDPSVLLVFLPRVGVTEADIWEAGEYLFSITTKPASRGLWTIYEKPELVTLCHAPAAGERAG
jgi:hypothetical protein